MHNNQKGSSVLIVIAIAVMFGIAVFAGVKVYEANFNGHANSDSQVANSKPESQSEEAIYYTITDATSNEEVKTRTANDGSEVILTSFDYSHTNGKKYAVETQQFSTKQKFACEETGSYFVMVMAGIGFECSFAFQTDGGIFVFHNNAIGNGDRSVYFVLGTTLLNVSVVEIDDTYEIGDERIQSAIVDKFTASQNPLPSGSN